MASFPPPRPVVHLPELPTQDEVLRTQKRARTVAALNDIECDNIGNKIYNHRTASQLHSDSNDSALCLHETGPLPASASNDEANQPQARSAPKKGVHVVQRSSSSVIMDFPESMEDGTAGLMHAQKPITEKPSMHALIRQAATSSATSVLEADRTQSSYRQAGLGFLYRLTNMRWKRAVDSALDISPMRSMLSHFSPSRFQRVLAFGLFGHVGNFDI